MSEKGEGEVSPFARRIEQSMKLGLISGLLLFAFYAALTLRDAERKRLPG